MRNLFTLLLFSFAVMKGMQVTSEITPTDFGHRSLVLRQASSVYIPDNHRLKATTPIIGAS